MYINVSSLLLYIAPPLLLYQTCGPSCFIPSQHASSPLFLPPPPPSSCAMGPPANGSAQKTIHHPAKGGLKMKQDRENLP